MSLFLSPVVIVQEAERRAGDAEAEEVDSPKAGEEGRGVEVAASRRCVLFEESSSSALDLKGVNKGGERVSDALHLTEILKKKAERRTGRQTYQLGRTSEIMSGGQRTRAWPMSWSFRSVSPNSACRPNWRHVRQQTSIASSVCSSGGEPPRDVVEAEGGTVLPTEDDIDRFDARELVDSVLECFAAIFLFFLPLAPPPPPFPSSDSTTSTILSTNLTPLCQSPACTDASANIPNVFTSAPLSPSNPSLAVRSRMTSGCL
jgi:hypothetical protein